MNISIELYASILLVVRLVSMGFMLSVLMRQWSLFKRNIPDHIRTYRVVLFILALVIFVGNIIPAGIDIYTLISDTPRPDRVPLMSVLYTFSASATALVSSILIWVLYNLARSEPANRDEQELAESAKLIRDK